MIALPLVAASCDDGGVSVDPAPVSTTTTQPSPAAESDGEYRLGVLLPREGAGKVLGDALLAGTRLATGAVQAEGVAGLPVEIIEREEPTDPAEAADVVEDLIENERIDALIGPASSANALAVLELIVANGLLTCSPTATASELSDFTDNGYFVRTIGSDRLLARAMAQTIDSLGVTRAAVLFPYDDYGIDVAVALRDDLHSRDISDVTLVHYTRDSLPEEVVDATLADAPQAVGVIGSLPSGAPILAELRSRPQGARVPTVVSDGMRSPELATIVDPADRTAVDGVRGVSPASAPTEPLASALEASGTTAMSYAAYAFDCVNLLALAAEAAESDHPDEARAEIADVSQGGVPCTTFASCRDELGQGRNIDYNGASGQLELNDQGDVSVATYDTFEFRDGMDVRSTPIFARL